MVNELYQIFETFNQVFMLSSFKYSLGLKTVNFKKISLLIKKKKKKLH